MHMKRAVRCMAIVMVVMVPVFCSAFPGEVPPRAPDPLAQMFESIRQARERSERMVAETLDRMTTPEVYDFYTRQNNLYKHHLMKALGAQNALEFLRPIEVARGNDPAVIISRLHRETDFATRAELIARLPQSAPFDAVAAEAAIRKRIGELEKEKVKIKGEEAKYYEDLDRVEGELTAIKRRVPRSDEEAKAKEGEVQKKLEEKWGILGKIEAAHRHLVEMAVEANSLRDYLSATNKDAKVAGITRGMGNDLRGFVGEIKDGKPVGGMRELWADIQANIAANRQAMAMPFQPGQAFFLKPPGVGNSANPAYSGFMPPVVANPSARAFVPSPIFMIPPQQVLPTTISQPTSLIAR